MFKKLTKKIVQDASEAITEEAKDQLDEYLPGLIALGTICLGLYLGTRSNSPKEVTKTLVMIVDSRGIHRV